MVGHTHEDIDQMFSCISTYLRKNSIQSMTCKVGLIDVDLFLRGIHSLASIVEKLCKLI